MKWNAHIIPSKTDDGCPAAWALWLYVFASDRCGCLLANGHVDLRSIHLSDRWDGEWRQPCPAYQDIDWLICLLVCLRDSTCRCSTVGCLHTISVFVSACLSLTITGPVFHSLLMASLQSSCPSVKHFGLCIFSPILKTFFLLMLNLNWKADREYICCLLTLSQNWPQFLKLSKLLTRMLLDNPFSFPRCNTTCGTISSYYWRCKDVYCRW